MRKIVWLKHLLFTCIGGLILSGCFSATPQVSPTANPTLVQSTIDSLKTQAAATVFTDLTLIAPIETSTTLPTTTPLPPTATLLPSRTSVLPTETSLPPTATRVPPSPTTAPSDTPLPPTPTQTPAPARQPAEATATPDSFKCQVTGQNPADGTVLKAGQDFDVDWIVKNTGGSAWSSDNYDISYLAGARMHKHGDRQDIKQPVNPGESTEILLDMRAPNDAGYYTETWGVVVGSSPVCVFSVSVQIEK